MIESVQKTDNSRKLTIVEATREGIREEMMRDDRVFIIGEDVGISPGGIGGSFAIFLGLSDEFGHDRVIDTPISEKAIIGACVGAAMMGLRPIAEFQYSDFAFCAMDELINEAPKMRYMSGGKLKVPMVVRAPVGSYKRGAQHSQTPDTYFCHTPGWKIAVPSNAYDAKGIIKTAVRDDNPVFIFEHKLLYGSKGPLKREVPGGIDLTCYVPEEEYLIPFGKAVIRREGTDVTIVATQLVLYWAMSAAERIEREEGISCEIIDPVTLVPLDIETILKSVSKTNRVIIAHEDTLSFGWGAEVAALIADEGFSYLDAPIKRVCSSDVPMPFSPIMEKYVLPNEERLYKEIKNLAT